MLQFKKQTDRTMMRLDCVSACIKFCAKSVWNITAFGGSDGRTSQRTIKRDSQNTLNSVWSDSLYHHD